MTVRWRSRFLWLTLLVCVPVPFFLVEIGMEPVIAMMEMLLVTLVVVAAEGGAGAITLTAWILGVQIFVASLLLWLVARIVAAILTRVFGSRTDVALFAIIAALLVLGFTRPIYRTPFSTDAIDSTLPQVFR
jgi:hypothetical protein